LIHQRHLTPVDPVDTGTTLVLIASNAFSAYERATGGVLDNTTGLLRLTTTQFASLQSLFFTVGSVSIHTLLVFQ
jgi:cathepsin E